MIATSGARKVVSKKQIPVTTDANPVRAPSPTPDADSIYEVLDEIESVIGVKLNRVISPARKGDPAVLLAAIDKAKNQLGWKPEASLNEIIASSWQGMKQLG